jgi:hypothetical protein
MENQNGTFNRPVGVNIVNKTNGLKTTLPVKNARSNTSDKQNWTTLDNSSITLPNPGTIRLEYKPDFQKGFVIDQVISGQITLPNGQPKIIHYVRKLDTNQSNWKLDSLRGSFTLDDVDDFFTITATNNDKLPANGSPINSESRGLKRIN